MGDSENEKPTKVEDLVSTPEVTSEPDGVVVDFRTDGHSAGTVRQDSN